MDKKEFVYSVGEIFGKVLDDERLSRYYIGPYQRGYKWASETEYDQVPQLLKDVEKAWKKKENNEKGDGEYFLQYVTVLRRNLTDVSEGEDCGDGALGAVHEDWVYEVIDGQQRLTTLAIIFDRLHRKCPDVKSIGRGENGKNRIEYARDESGHGLYEKIEAIDEEGELEDTQDMYYIKSAVQRIDKFLEGMSEEEKKGYAEFLLDSVKIILNRESDFVSAEDVFVNLNGNSVELTNAYLIKGLLLTRSVNTEDRHGDAYSYFNIMEQRKVNGRVWDEIQNWVEQKDVARFFFGKDENGMENLLTLMMSAYGDGYEGMDGGLRLFNKYNEVVATDDDGLRWMGLLQHCYRKLRSWHEDAEVYNLMGYVLFMMKQMRMNILSDSLDMSNEEMMKVLAEWALRILPRLDDPDKRKDPAYGDQRLTPLLLSLNVFPEGWGKDKYVAMKMPRFNFPDYDRQKWTMEHIRPRNPRNNNLILPEEAKEMVMKMYEREQEKNDTKGEEESSERIKIVRQQIEEGKIENVEEALPFLYSDLTDEQENGMGNMALLSNSVNSSISNNPYLIKRFLIFRKVNEGAFIPPHTVAVFTKAINGTQLSIDLMNWDADDVAAHEAWMRERNKQIRTALEEKAGINKDNDK